MMVFSLIDKLIRNIVSRVLMNAKFGVSILLVVVALQSTSETIFVGGVMEESQTWTSDNTYIVYQDLIIPSGVMLSIKEGVLVKIDNALGIIVTNGSIKVEGTKTDSVNFVPNHTSPGQIWKWSGLIIRNANNENKSSINYAKLINAETAIKIENSWEVVIENSSIFNCQNIGVNIINSSSCLVLNCTIENNYDGIEMLAGYLESTSNNVIYECIVRNQNHNIYIFREEGGGCRNNLILRNLIESGNNGIWIDNSGGEVVSENIIEQNFIINNGAGVGYGIFLAHDSTVVSNNIFWENNIAILSEAKGDNCIIRNNSFYQNNNAISIGGGSEGNKHLNNTFSLNTTELLGIKETQGVEFRRNNLLNNKGFEDIVVNSTPFDLSITGNYWGTVDSSQISRLIFDGNENPDLGILYYTPFLSSIDTSNPMSPPYHVIKQIIDNKVQISWHANQEPDLMAYRVYYGNYSNYSFSKEDEAGMDTSFVFPGDISIYDPIAVTAFDSTIVANNGQLFGHESPFAFAVLYPYAGNDTIICEFTNELEIVNSNIPFGYQSINWSTSGDGLFNNTNILNPIYFPGSLDIQNGGATITLKVNSVVGSFEDEFRLSIIDNPVAFAGNDTVVAADSEIFLDEAVAQHFESVIWFTSGDGSFDNDTLVNPIYFPGFSDTESDIVYLEMIAYSVCGIATDTIAISIEPHFSVEGKIWTINKPANPGVVVAYIENKDATRAIQIENAESDGSFRFENLITGNYYLYALPDTNNSDNVVPGYYANKLKWQSAYLLPVDADVYDIDIHLPSTDFKLPTGEGSISGHMVIPHNSKYNSDIYCIPWFDYNNNVFCSGGLSNVTVFLFNDSRTKLFDYTLTDELGNFYFSELPFGNYIVDAEKAGFLSIPSPLISLSPEHKSETDVVLEINQQKIGISFDNDGSLENSISVFPNPAINELNIPYSNPLSLALQIEICDLFGNRILKITIPVEQISEVIKLNINGLSPGLYFGQLINSSLITHFQFVKK